MTSLHDGSCTFRSGDGAAQALASARRVLRRLPPADARLRLVRPVANKPAAPARLVLLHCLPALLDRTPTEVISHG